MSSYSAILLLSGFAIIIFSIDSPTGQSKAEETKSKRVNLSDSIKGAGFWVYSIKTFLTPSYFRSNYISHQPAFVLPLAGRILPKFIRLVTYLILFIIFIVTLKYVISAVLKNGTSKWPQNGNVMQEVLNLLSTQKTHHQKIEALFKKMCDKNLKHEHYELLVRSCGGKLEFCDGLITNNTEIVEAYVKNGSASDDFKKEPLSYQASRELTDCWKHIDDYNTNYAPQFDFNVTEETEAMREPLASAIAEIEEYSKYLDDLYEKSNKTQPEFEYFLYPKYGKHKRAN